MLPFTVDTELPRNNEPVFLSQCNKLFHALIFIQSFNEPPKCFVDSSKQKVSFCMFKRLNLSYSWRTEFGMSTEKQHIPASLIA